MDALRSTINTQAIKTKQIVYQNPDGTFPEPGSVLHVTDVLGHTDWTRNPILDTITLVDASGYTGTLSYTDVSGLMVNNVSVGGDGGDTVFGGTNISVSGPAYNRVVSFNPSGGVDMCGNTLTNADRIEMGRTTGTVNPLLQMNYPASGAGRNATIRMTDGTATAEIRSEPTVPLNLVAPTVRQTVTERGEIVSTTGTSQTLYVNSTADNAHVGLISGNTYVESNRPIILQSENIFNSRVTTTLEGGVLKVQNGTDTPTIKTDTIGSNASISINSTYATIPSTVRKNTIAMVTDGSGESGITMTDGNDNAHLIYSTLGSTSKLNMNCNENVSITTSGSNQAIEMGSTLGKIEVSTSDQAIVLRRNAAGGAPIKTYLSLEDNGVVQIGESTATTTTKPTLYFQGNIPTYAQIEFDNSSSLLKISGSGVTSTMIATPLFDEASTSAGIAKQVLTSRGPGLSPYWADVSSAVVSITGSSNMDITTTAGAVVVDLSDNVAISGRMGVGTAIPTSAATLDVSGQIHVTNGNTSKYLMLQQGTDTNSYVRTVGGGTLSLGTGSTNTVSVLPSGNVGVGTTTPTKLLSLGNTTAQQKLALYDDGTGSNFYGFGAIGLATHFHAATSNGANGQMVLTSNGLVGIGTTTPIQTLDVSGSVGISGAAGAGALRLTQQSGITYIESGVNPTSGSAAPLYFTDYNASNTNMIINPRSTYPIVVVGQSGSFSISYSYDGVTWAAASGGFTGNGQEVAFGIDKFVAVGFDNTFGGQTIKYSTNGISWNSASGSVFGAVGRGIGFGNNQWIALGDTGSGSTIKYSSNGISWTDAGGGFSTQGNGAAYGTSNTWVAVGAPNTESIKYSTNNGVNWSNASSTFTGPAYGVAYGNGRWVAVGNDTSSTGNTIKYSTDGINWTTASGGFTNSAFGVAYGGGNLWVAVGGPGGQSIKYSTDNGNTWTTASGSLFSTTGYNVSYLNGKWYAVGDDFSNIIKSSTDGINWTNVGSGTIIGDGNGVAIGPTISPMVGINTTTPAYTLDVNGNGRFVGALTKGSGAFEIAHPVVPNTKLVHSFIEGPRCDLIYRGRKQLVDGVATIDIEKESTGNGSEMSPGTFVALCINPQIYLQNNASFDRVVGSITDNILTVRCENTASTDNIDWMVIAERHDPFIKTWDRTDADGLLVLEHPSTETE